KKPDGEQTVPESESCHFKFDKTDFLLNRLHGLFLLSFSADNSSVSISLWQDEWLPKMADAGKLPVAHTRDDLGRLLLTAETEDLSDWVKDLPKDAFDKERVLTRRDGQDNEQGSSGNANSRSYQERKATSVAGGDGAGVRDGGRDRTGKIVLLAEAA